MTFFHAAANSSGCVHRSDVGGTRSLKGELVARLRKKVKMAREKRVPYWPVSVNIPLQHQFPI